MWNKTSKEKEELIVSLYKSGNSYREIKEKTGIGCNTIQRIIQEKNCQRTVSEALVIAYKQDKIHLTEKGKISLSNAGKAAVKRNKKFWTKPEQEFKLILNSIGIGVCFPNYIKEILQIEDDENSTIKFQYPIQRYVCDFVDIENKIVFRINGDFWHANPILYDYENLTKIQKHNIRQDKNSRIFLEKRKWKVCDIWESEIYWNKELVIEKIRAMRELVNPPVLQTGNDWSVTNIAYQKDWSEKLKTLWFKKPKKRITYFKTCPFCGKEFSVQKSKLEKRKFCSKKCVIAMQRKKSNKPSYKRLKKLLDNNSLTSIGHQFGVSANTIKKWTQSFNLEIKHAKNKHKRKISRTNSVV